MPNIKSAKKRVKTNRRDEIRNRAAKSTLKSTLKSTAAVIQAGADQKAIKEVVQETQSLIGHTWKRGIIHKNKMARLQSRLARQANAAKANQK